MGDGNYFLGNYAKSKKILKNALSINEKHFGSDSIETSKSLGLLGKTYLQLGKNNKAKQLLTRALSMQEKIYGIDHITALT